MATGVILYGSTVATVLKLKLTRDVAGVRLLVCHSVRQHRCHSTKTSVTFIYFPTPKRQDGETYAATGKDEIYAAAI
jgi:hypothetical protein